MTSDRANAAFRKSALLLAVSSAALALAGCKVDNRPLLARGSEAPSYAEAALPQPGLPTAAPDPYGTPAYGAQPYPARYAPPQRAYPYAERAYGYTRAFYDTPPNYAFAYGDEQPWAWQAADDSLMFAEPYGEDYRFYYYEPGQAYPYFVRDDRYGYAYGDNGVLMAVFDAAGALLGANDYGRYSPQAHQYWSRGYELYSSYGREPRSLVDPGLWSQRAPRIAQYEQRWMAAPEQQPQWRSWRASASPEVLRRYDSPRPGRAYAAEGRPDNGLHRGWDRGRGNPHARMGEAPGFARSAQDHGYDSAFREPDMRGPRGGPQMRDHGEGHGHGRGDDRQFAIAQPGPAFQGGGGPEHGHGADKGQDHGNGGGHGGGGDNGDGGHGHGKHGG